VPAPGGALVQERNPRHDYRWVDLNTSLQWQAFQSMVEILQQSGNRVFVLVGPFNEHLLTEQSLQRYQHVKATIAALGEWSEWQWLRMQP
jgi:hypothetical protein